MPENAHIWSMGAALMRAAGEASPLVCREHEWLRSGTTSRRRRIDSPKDRRSGSCKRRCRRESGRRQVGVLSVIAGDQKLRKVPVCPSLRRKLTDCQRQTSKKRLRARNNLRVAHNPPTGGKGQQHHLAASRRL